MAENITKLRTNNAQELRYFLKRVAGLTQTRSDQLINDEEASLLATLAAQARLAAQSIRPSADPNRELTSRLGELYILQEMSQQLNASLDSQQIIDLCLEWAIRSSSATVGLVATFDAAHQLEAPRHGQVLGYYGYPLDLRASPPPPAWFAQRLVSGVLNTAEPVLVTDLAQQPDYVPIAPEMRSQIIAPLCQEYRPFGVLYLESALPDAFDHQDVEFLYRLADCTATALANARLYESVKHANEAKAEFISNVAHELRNPLTAIKGFVGILSRGVLGPLGDQQLAYLHIIETNAERMSGLVSDLLDMAQLESGTERFSPRPVQMTEIARQVIESLGKQAQAKGQRLALVCYSTPLPEALGDSGRLAQVLTNLISNAVKYTPQGGKIEVSLEAAPEANHLTARVSDTGIGISVTDQQKLFTRFFRADHPSVHAENGTGLGLSIVKRIVEMHGGTISVYSVPEQGSTFSFTVPLAK